MYVLCQQWQPQLLRWSHLALGDLQFADKVIGRLHMHAQSVRSVPSCVRLLL